MKSAGIIFLFLFFTHILLAGDTYRKYLNLKISESKPQLLKFRTPDYFTFQQAGPSALARYTIPTGAIFCRMEDKLIKATKVWITIGVK
jgi:hypothetical protein